MDAFIAMLKEMGPFAVPVCIAMVGALRWLLQDRERLIKDLEAARKDASDLRDKRAEDQKAAARELVETSKAVTHAMQGWAERVDKVTRGKEG